MSNQHEPVCDQSTGSGYCTCDVRFTPPGKGKRTLNGYNAIKASVKIIETELKNIHEALDNLRKTC